jgi:hypothetical protein
MKLLESKEKMHSQCSEIATCSKNFFAIAADFDKREAFVFAGRADLLLGFCCFCPQKQTFELAHEMKGCCTVYFGNEPQAGRGSGAFEGDFRQIQIHERKCMSELQKMHLFPHQIVWY